MTPIHVTAMGLDADGVRLISPADEEFDSRVDALSGPEWAQVLKEAKPSIVIVSNDAARQIVALSVAAGVPTEVASRIYTEMAYLGSMSSVLVVDQEGQRLQFTTAWKLVAEVKDLVVLPRKNGGEAAIDLRREDGTIRVIAIR